MKIKILIIALISIFSASMYSQTVPTPDHVVILMLENQGYGDIIGSSNAPYINSLANDPSNAVFTQSFALTHPSQPNYIMLYSGNNQGITNDDNITNSPFSTPNLGAALLSNGHTFTGYSEDLPSMGSLAYYSANYGRKHAPWANWQGTGTNRVPASVNQPYSSFPTSSTFSTLPTVSFVIPNLNNDMHNPTNNPSTAISNGDNWIQNNLANYISWAKSNNSLLIITFDEDRGTISGGQQTTSNRITTLFIGEMVQGGNYSTHIDHYNVLRTIEDMYSLSYCGNSATSSPITNCWKSITTGIEQNNSVGNRNVSVGPIPAKENFSITLVSPILDKGSVSIFDVTGKLVKKEDIDIEIGKSTSKIDATNLSAGIYIVKILSTGIDFTKKIILQ